MNVRAEGLLMKFMEIAVSELREKDSSLNLEELEVFRLHFMWKASQDEVPATPGFTYEDEEEEE